MTSHLAFTFRLASVPWTSGRFLASLVSWWVASDQTLGPRDPLPALAVIFLGSLASASGGLGT